MAIDVCFTFNQRLRTISLRIFSILFVVILLLTSCNGRVTQGGSSGEKNDTISNATLAESPSYYHFMVENSGSMKGYFKGNSRVKEILKNLYDRLDEQLNVDSGDTITLNYINTEIVSFNGGIEPFLQQIWSKCTASFTKLDDILSMAFAEAKSESVTILVSDYCFASNVGNLETAKSGITNLLTKGLKENPELSIAILKFNSDFDGKYYPGGLPCKQSLPFYVWVFGDASKVKKVIELPNIVNDGMLVLQSAKSVIPEICTKTARMKGESVGFVKVKEWGKDRHGDSYTLTYKFDVSDIIVGKEAILNYGAYQVPSGYTISNIEMEDNMCTMSIMTKHPSPGKLCIEYQNKLPRWVEDSNFDGTGIPSEGKTLGIKSLIEGVYNAYSNKDKNIFTINITLQ